MSTTATIDQRVYRIPNMDCAAEEAEIRHALRDIAGLRGLRFRLGARELHVEALPGSLAEIEASLRAAGFAPATDPGAAHDAAHDHDHGHSHGPAQTPARPAIDWRSALLAPGLPRIGAALVLALAAEFFGADALIVSGRMTGDAPDLGKVREARALAEALGLLIGSGATAENVGAFLSIADGVIVGSSIKQGGACENPVDVERVKRFVDAARAGR